MKHFVKKLKYESILLHVGIILSILDLNLCGLVLELLLKSHILIEYS